MEPRNDVTVRAARPEEVPEIVRLLWEDPQGRVRESVGPEAAPAYARAFAAVEADPNTMLFVALRGGRVIGCAQMRVTPGLSYGGAWRALVEDVRVAASERGRGVGRAILDHVEQAARARGCALIELFVHESRDRAQAFYAQAGYVGAHRGFRKSLT